MKRQNRSRGSALLIAVIVVILVVGLGGAFLSETVFRGSHQSKGMRADEAQVICDAGLEIARLALKEWRNTDSFNNPDPRAYAWNQIFQYCLDKDQTSPGLGTSADSDAIKKDYLALYASGVLKPGGSATPGSNVPSTFDQLLCVQRPYGRGAYYLVFRNNLDLYGNGADDDQDGDSWNADTPGEVALGNSSPVIDGDRKGIVVITATLSDGTQRQIEALVEYPERTYTPSAALLDNGTIKMNGSFEIVGTKGLVHANEDVIGNGGNAIVQVAVNASGSTANFTMNNPPPGGINSGAAPATIPAIDDVYALLKTPEMAPFMSDVVVLKADGKAYSADQTTQIGLATDFGFKMQAGAWQLSGNSSNPPPRVYFFEGDVKMSGQGNAQPYNMSIIATGNVQMTGNAAFSAFYKTDASGNTLQTNTLIVAGKDLELGGTGGLNLANPQYTGAAFAVEQIKIHGNFTLKGAIIGENLRDSVGSDITTSSQVEPDATVIGNPTISYNGGGTFLPAPAQSVTVRSVRRLK